MKLTSDDMGGTRTARVGERVEVSLPENPTTGYRWQLDVDAEALRTVDDRYESSGPLRGAAGIRTITVEVARGGPIELRMVKRRAWESAVAPAEEYVVRLDVAAGEPPR